MKNLIKIFLICTLLLLALSVTASAATEGYYTYTVSNGEATITDVSTSISGNITIPSTLGGYPVTTIGYRAFYSCDSLTSVEIGDSITTIGDYAFYSCYRLTSVEILDSVTTIGDDAFSCCKSLTSVVIGDSVTTIGDYAFSFCDRLASVEIPDSVTAIGDYAFFYCDGLTNVVIGDSITVIGNAFLGCESLTRVDVSENNKKYCSENGVLFNKNKTILIYYPIGKVDKTYIIPDSVTIIDAYAFYGCTGLTNVVIGDSVTTIGDCAFSDCGSLTSVYYRGISTQWTNINIGSYNSDLTSANIIYNAVKIKAYDKNDGILVDEYVDSTENKYESLLTKKGYTPIIYIDGTFTKTIDANSYITEDVEVYVDYVINQYTYKFIDCDGTVLKEVTVDYQTVIEEPENPTREGDAKYSSYTFSQWSGYTEGMKLTRDITFTAVYDTTYNHHIELTGTTSATVGNSFTEKVSMVTLKPVNYLVCEIIYPDVLELNSITPRDFKYASKESLKTKDGFNYLTVMCQYADDDKTVPENTSINPFNLSFTVSKTAKPQEIEIKFAEDTYLSGEEDYAFENKIDAKIEILPKLASSVTIYGNSTIYEPTQFTAEVYPDYTTDKSIEWSVDDETVATISKDGILTPVKNGSVTIKATAVGGAYKTKTVTVYRKAYVDGFKSDVGMWNKKVLPDTKEYTIYVTEDTSVINITPLFTSGTLSYNGAVMMKNRAKEFELAEDETTITFTRVNSGYETCTYTIKVIKKPGIKNKIIKAGNFKEDCRNLLVCNNKTVEIEEVEDVTITVPEDVNSYKIFYWESLANLKPVYAPIVKEF